MPYTVQQQHLDSIGKALVDYYEQAWTDGVHSLFDRMAQANMGKVSAALDVGQGAYEKLRRKSMDKFMVTFKAKFEGEVKRYFSNMPEVMNQALPIAKMALEKLAGMIPVPMVGAVLTKAIGAGAGLASTELQKRAVQQADKQVTGASGGEVRTRFRTEEDAKKAVDEAVKQYKSVATYLGTMPKNISTFDDAITFPGSVFKVQAAASHLNVMLEDILEYVRGMQSRLGEVQTAYGGFKNTLGTSMPKAVDNVLQSAYNGGLEKGTVMMQQGKQGPSAPPAPPQFLKPGSPETGGATQLAEFVAHAIAMGVFTAFNNTRGRGASVQPITIGQSRVRR